MQTENPFSTGNPGALSIPLSRTAEVSLEGVAAAYERRWGARLPGADDAGSPTCQMWGSGASVFTCVVTEGMFPAAGLAGPVSTARLWPDAAQDIAAHAAFLPTMVQLPGGAGRVFWMLTQLTVAVVEATSVMGVYWHPQVIRSDHLIDIVDRAGAAGRYPIELWFDIREHDVEGVRVVSTDGFDLMGQPDIEIVDPHVPVEELRPALYDAIRRILVGGDGLEDGDSVGSIAGREHRSFQTVSQFRPSVPVRRFVAM